MKVMKISKYEQNRDDITCKNKVEIEINVHSDVKQAGKRQFLMHMIKCNTNY